MTRTILPGAVALLLAGCNMVVTPAPLLTVADQAGGAPLRPGVWRVEKPDCDVDEAEPMADWPKCSMGLVWNGDGTAGYYDRDPVPPVRKTQSTIFSPGTPGVLQAEVTIGGDVTVSSKPFAYVGIHPRKSDDQGRVVAFTLWPVLCGKPTPGDEDSMTKALLPGLEAKPGDPVCTTASKDALRGAARASEPWAPKIIAAHWVRDGEK